MRASDSVQRGCWLVFSPSVFKASCVTWHSLSCAYDNDPSSKKEIDFDYVASVIPTTRHAPIQTPDKHRNIVTKHCLISCLLNDVVRLFRISNPCTARRTRTVTQPGQNQVCMHAQVRRRINEAPPKWLQRRTVDVTQGRAHQWNLAVGLLRSMPKQSMEPDVVTYSVLIEALGRAVQWPLALELLSATRAAGVALDLKAWSAGLVACERGAQWDHALELLSQIRLSSLKPDSVLFGSVMTACEKAWLWDRALRLLHDSLESGCKPSAVLSSVAISACSKAEQWGWSLSLLQKMQESGIPVV